MRAQLNSNGVLSNTWVKIEYTLIFTLSLKSAFTKLRFFSLLFLRFIFSDGYISVTNLIMYDDCKCIFFESVKYKDVAFYL